MATVKHIVRRAFGASSGANGIRVADDTLLLDRDIYKGLSNLTDNKTLTIPVGIETKFDKFLIAFNSDTLTDELIVLNEYLGSLGLDAEYPFSQDVPDIANWIDYSATARTRNVAVGDDNLAYGSDNVVLIQGN